MEIGFRDEYLARSDMWRLVISELSNKTIYTGQKILFMGSIKAQIKHIYIRGRKSPSAYFSAGTRPIFRSESARCVFLIQMSSEMWEFDSDASGEIMFNRVIGGFLPELFQRWMTMSARHLISIVLFTRIEYDRPRQSSLNGEDNLSRANPSAEAGSGAKLHKDFFRVVVSEMTSGSWVSILDQLKKEFKVFRRDISIQLNSAPSRAAVQEALAPDRTNSNALVMGQPSAAIHGNVLEAINLASLQFATDYIDRDLVRTGISIVVVTPGTGLFEVDYETLRTTTDMLIDNGIGIDLVCLSKMPLHSVPLFKYQNPSPLIPRKDGTLDQSTSGESTPRQLSSAFGSFSSAYAMNPSPSKALALGASPKPTRPDPTPGKWSYAVPHWIDVSFWTGSSDLSLRLVEGGAAITKLTCAAPEQPSGFVPRIKMYELQMMGIMENEMSNISIPYLHRAPGNSKMRSATYQARWRSEAPAQNGRRLSGPKETDGATPEPFNIANSSFARYQSPHVLSKADKEATRWMEVHDEHAFRPLGQLKAAERKAQQLKAKEDEKTREADSLLFGTSYNHARSPTESYARAGSAYFDRKMKERQVKKDTGPKRKGSNSSLAAGAPVPMRASRQLSSGLRLLGSAAPKALASIELKTEHARPEPVLRSNESTSHISQSPDVGSHEPMREPRSEVDDASVYSKDSVDDGKSGKDKGRDDVEKGQRSTPIAIKRSTTSPGDRRDEDAAHGMSASGDSPLKGTGKSEKMDVLQAASKTKQAGPKFDLSMSGPAQSLTLSPTNALTPWLTPLNPSNPKKHNAQVGINFGRWQHIFPRPTRASSMKWKSLCSPAVSPLTTELFPTAEQLAYEYQENPYNISQNEEDEPNETVQARDVLIKELIALRLAQGFQIVVGDAVAKAMGQASLKLANLFDSTYATEDGAMVVMSRGNTIHQLQCIEGNEVEVKRFVRKPPAAATMGPRMADSEPTSYLTAVRTALASSYEPRHVVLHPTSEEYNWNYVDSFIAGYEEEFTEHLRFWRARFVLIPVDQPHVARRSLHTVNEDNEEEVRIEGIRKLTQMWQRYRHVPPEERSFQSPKRQRKDANPLDIVYQTRDPSAVVTAELDGLSLVDTETAGRRSHLFAETEPFQRSSVKYAALAQEIQGERGIAMQDRRWHLRLHSNCFIGFEMTTWLLENFRDVDTREEAVELGNELMNGGLFQHVERRHQFRDGNYFYQIASDYRTTRPESRRSWFGTRKTDRSVPSTPINGPVGGSPRTEVQRSSSELDESSDEGSGMTPTAIGSKRFKVALSKVMRYDVDHRKRSYRSELINLHYDRLHNPDNCYHIRIGWMNVTAKLIEDAIVSWATTAEKYGLKMVEVPIGEASTITDIHPFRSPYLISLARAPPRQRPPSQFDSTWLSPSVETDRHYYHRAVLKKFDFVLDIEAAKNFPSDVEVTYSWGKPDYRYTQYIHRSGNLLAQVTDEGDILLLANRLYNDRSAASMDRYDKADQHDRRGGQSLSPISSPLVRATPDVLREGGNLGREGESSGWDPMRVKNELESFCWHAEGLAKFYDQVLAKPTSPGPNTPMLAASIPALGLPPSLRDLSPAPMTHSPGRVASRSTGNSSPKASVTEPH